MLCFVWTAPRRVVSLTACSFARSVALAYICKVLQAISLVTYPSESLRPIFGIICLAFLLCHLYGSRNYKTALLCLLAPFYCFENSMCGLVSAFAIFAGMVWVYARRVRVAVVCAAKVFALLLAEEYAFVFLVCHNLIMV